MYHCDICNDESFTYHDDDEGRFIAVPCTCRGIRNSIRLMENSGITDAFLRCTFDSYKTMNLESLQRGKRQAEKYVEDFLDIEKKTRNSILFSGQVGAGKTHLGIAISQELIQKGIAVSYMPYRTAVTKLKQNIVNDEAAYEKELNQYRKARVLFIDDFLKGKITESDINMMYEIVNYRYMNQLPMIISTEKSLKELIQFDEAIGSRIIEMSREHVVVFKDKSLNYRLKQEVV